MYASILKACNIVSPQKMTKYYQVPSKANITLHIARLTAAMLTVSWVLIMGTRNTANVLQRNTVIHCLIVLRFTSVFLKITELFFIFCGRTLTYHCSRTWLEFPICSLFLNHCAHFKNNLKWSGGSVSPLSDRCLCFVL